MYVVHDMYMKMYVAHDMYMVHTWHMFTQAVVMCTYPCGAHVCVCVCVCVCCLYVRECMLHLFVCVYIHFRITHFFTLVRTYVDLHTYVYGACTHCTHAQYTYVRMSHVYTQYVLNPVANRPSRDVSVRTQGHLILTYICIRTM